MRPIFSLLFSAFFLTSTPLLAADETIPSCYNLAGINEKAPAPTREVFIFIDQTTLLDAELTESVQKNVSRLIAPGTAFVVGAFSAFAQNHYLNILSAGTLQSSIAEEKRGAIGVKVLRQFDDCLKKQSDYGRKLAAQSLQKALAGSQDDLAKSDVISSLSAISERVRQSKAADKIVFIVSDMLENSSISSFYSQRNVRAIDVAAEIKKVEAQKMVGDFANARVFVLGAGLVSPEKGKPGVYRDAKTMQRLQAFWKEYFRNSHAELAAFGMPALLVPVE